LIAEAKRQDEEKRLIASLGEMNGDFVKYMGGRREFDRQEGADL